MRTLEVLMLLLLLPAVGGLLGPRSWMQYPMRRWMRLSWALAAITFVLHAYYEGPHWQMVPAYLALIAAGFALFEQRLRWWMPRLTGAACLLLVAISVGASWLLPMFRLPMPTGRYPVGTTIVHLVDASRREIHGMAPRGPRELMVQIWYPAEGTKKPLAPYRRWAETTALSSYMAMIRTHSQVEAEVAHPVPLFPVLLFSPGWKNSRTESVWQMEDLASHGFVVVAIDYPYNSQPVAFSDGRVLFSKETRDIDDFTGHTAEDALAYANAEANYEAQDNSFVLDQLELMNFKTGNRFFVALDTKHVGAFGHSFGGGVAMETALRDSRVLGAINYDGWTFGDVGEAGLPKPFMIMYEPYPAPSIADLTSSDRARRSEAEVNRWDQANIQRALEAHGGYRVFIPTAKHMNFADRSLYSPLRSRTDSGTIDPVRVHEIVEAYTLAFFSQLLKRDSEPLLEAVPSPFPEVRYEVFARR